MPFIFPINRPDLIFSEACLVYFLHFEKRTEFGCRAAGVHIFSCSFPSVNFHCSFFSTERKQKSRFDSKRWFLNTPSNAAGDPRFSKLPSILSSFCLFYPVYFFQIQGSRRYMAFIRKRRSCCQAQQEGYTFVSTVFFSVIFPVIFLRKLNLLLLGRKISARPLILCLLSFQWLLFRDCSHWYFQGHLFWYRYWNLTVFSMLVSLLKPAIF